MNRHVAPLAARLVLLAACDGAEHDLGLSADRAEVTAGGYLVYYGNLHSHTSISDGSGTLAQAYTRARDQAGLDFFSVSEHDYYTNDMTDGDWSDIREAANTYNVDGEFVALWGFEWTSDVDVALGLGHFTVINSEDYCFATKEPTRTLNQFTQWLDTQDAIAIFNHPGQYDTTFGGFEFDHSDKIVGMELWNRSKDYYENNGYYSNDGGLGFFDEALTRGWYIGAGGGQDNHDKTWGTLNEWRIAVLATEKTRASIVAALKARRFYSSRDRNLGLSFECSGAQMGSKIGPGRVDCSVAASDSDGESFTSIEAVKNGVVAETWTPNQANATQSFSIDVADGDYVYVRVYQGSSWTAISSPVFFSGDAPPSGGGPDAGGDGPRPDPSQPDAGPGNSGGGGGSGGGAGGGGGSAGGDGSGSVVVGCRAATSSGSASLLLSGLAVLALGARRRRTR